MLRENVLLMQMLAQLQSIGTFLHVITLMQKYLSPHTAAIKVGGIDDTHERVGFGIFVFDVSRRALSVHTRCHRQLCNSRQLLLYAAIRRTCGMSMRLSYVRKTVDDYHRRQIGSDARAQTFCAYSRRPPPSVGPYVISCLLFGKSDL